MIQQFAQSPFFGISLTALIYCLACKLQEKTGHVLCNPCIVATIGIIAVLQIFRIPYDAYNQGGTLISMFLGPATGCLAVSIYTRRALLKKNLLPILVGCTAGVLTSVGSIWAMCRLFGLDAALTAAILPKSVTTPIATAIAESHGGIVPITVAAVMISGMMGNLCAPYFIRWFRVKDAVAAGLGIGACSHAMGTAKALELGETEGAVSGLAIGLCGILTTVAALFFQWLL